MVIMLEHDGWYELHCTQECVHYFPPTSPDMTPPDFFVLGYIKENCFKPPVPTTLEQLKQSVLHVINCQYGVTFRMLCAAKWQEH